MSINLLKNELSNQCCWSHLQRDPRTHRHQSAVQDSESAAELPLTRRESARLVTAATNCTQSNLQHPLLCTRIDNCVNDMNPCKWINPRNMWTEQAPSLTERQADAANPPATMNHDPHHESSKTQKTLCFVKSLAKLHVLQSYKSTARVDVHCNLMN